MKMILLRASNAAAASLRTTTATTVIRGGTKFNVLPFNVKAYVNHRVHPDDTIDDVIAFDRRVINDERIKIQVYEEATPPSPISTLENRAFKFISQTVAEVFGRPTTNSIMIGNTDTRHYWELSGSIYRFSPCELAMSDLGMFHGLNERISVDNVPKIVLYYKTLIEKLQTRNI